MLSHMADLKEVVELLLADNKVAAIAKFEGAVTKLERHVGNDYRRAKIAERRKELGLPPSDEEPS
jgi:hypothetical protein